MERRFEKRMINVLRADHLAKEKVVWVQSGNDFVDLLYSFLTMPLGTIVRLLENHGRPRRNTVKIGCFNNLYKSVVDISIEHFRTESCKQMLVYPKSVKEGQCRKLKINIDDTEATKCFMCPMYLQRKSCGEFFSNFNTSRCSCGELMNKEVMIPEGEERCCYDDYDGVFVHGDGNMAFIVSDDLKIENFSWDLFKKRLKDLGCVNVLDELGEGEPEISVREVLLFNVS